MCIREDPAQPKINTVIVDDINKDEIIDFVNLTKEKNIDIRFIELMPIGAAKKYKGMSNKEINHIIKSNFKYLNLEDKNRKSHPQLGVVFCFGSVSSFFLELFLH